MLLVLIWIASKVSELHQKSMQFKWVPTTYAIIKKLTKSALAVIWRLQNCLAAAIGVCVVIRSNKVDWYISSRSFIRLKNHNCHFWFYEFSSLGQNSCPGYNSWIGEDNECLPLVLFFHERKAPEGGIHVPWTLFICPFEKRSYYIMPLCICPSFNISFRITPTVYIRSSWNLIYW